MPLPRNFAPGTRSSCWVFDLGILNYADAFLLQRELVRRRKEQSIPDALLLVEHPHVITLGRSGNLAHLLVDESDLLKLGVEYFQTDRGGDITYHGPGQLVVYPIMDLKDWLKDIHLFLRTLEDCVIKVLGDFGISAGRIPGATGVWVYKEKIAAIGVRTSQWVTSHGLALNVNPNLDFFDLIIPCGIRDKGVTSLERLLGSPQEMVDVKSRLVRHFMQLFNREPLYLDSIPPSILSPVHQNEEKHAF
jgi:lipoyl(octanoyl) transferase